MSLQFWVLLLIILWDDAQIRLVVSIVDCKYKGESQMKVVQPSFSFSAIVSKKKKRKENFLELFFPL